MSKISSQERLRRLDMYATWLALRAAARSPTIPWELLDIMWFEIISYGSQLFKRCQKDRFGSERWLGVSLSIHAPPGRKSPHHNSNFQKEVRRKWTMYKANHQPSQTSKRRQCGKWIMYKANHKPSPISRRRQGGSRLYTNLTHRQSRRACAQY